VRVVAAGYSVAVIGGSSAIPGLHDRLEAELQKLEPAVDGDGAPPRRVLPFMREAAWVGASLVGANFDPQVSEEPKQGSLQSWSTWLLNAPRED